MKNHRIAMACLVALVLVVGITVAWSALTADTGAQPPTIVAQAPGPASSPGPIPKEIDFAATSDDPTFGFSKDNPIKLGCGEAELDRYRKILRAAGKAEIADSPVASVGCGAFMSKLYLSRLRDKNFKPFTFERHGNVGAGADGHIVDWYKLVDTEGKEYEIYIDMYHPESPAWKCKVPKGMYFSNE